VPQGDLTAGVAEEDALNPTGDEHTVSDHEQKLPGEGA
jgi:hypothetical protein